MPDGTARIVNKALVDMVTDGPCLAGTLEQLEGGGAAKPMPRAALAKVREDALGLLGKVLEAYTTRVSVGEVGVTGPPWPAMPHRLTAGLRQGSCTGECRVARRSQ